LGVLVGREEELARLEQLLRPDGGPVVVVYGEAGIGKTSLVAEFARHARDGGAEMLWGTCHEEETPQPFLPWIEGLSRYIDGLPPARALDLLADEAPVLCELIPSAPGRNGRSAAPGDPVEDRYRLYDAVATVLDRIGERVLVVLDDVQWADAQTFELLLHTARACRRAQFVVAYRVAELGLDDRATPFLARIHRIRGCEYLHLTALSHSASKDLLARASEGSIDAERADKLARDAAGNPFFLTELGRHFRSRPGAELLPDTIRAAIGLRLNELSPEARHVLELASVFSGGVTVSERGAANRVSRRSQLSGPAAGRYRRPV
jgi:predicted ATPase